MKSPAASESLTQGEYLAHVGFILTGVVNTLLGPILPIITRTWHLNDAQAGRLFAAQFCGAIASTLASGRVMNAIGIRRCAMLGLLLMSAGVSAIGISNSQFGALAVICFGLGLGFAVPAINLWVALANPQRSAAALNLVNASWCIGAASGAPAIIFLADKFGLVKTLAAIGILLALTALAGFVAAGLSPALRPAALTPPPKFAHAAKTVAPLTQSAHPLAVAAIPQSPPLDPLAQRPFIVLMCAFLFFYVGIETGVGGWAATYATRLHLLAPSRIGLAQSIFYGALLLGRVLAPLALRRMSALRLLLCGLLVGAAGAALFTFAPLPPEVLAGICIAGIGLAPIFPVTVSLYSDELGAAATNSAAVLFAIADVGGAVFPWLIGRVSTSMNDLRYGMAVPLACIAAMLIIMTRLSRTMRPQ
jgi:FHS family glucose/mannose:H+ symporter-like MFS transporter